MAGAPFRHFEVLGPRADLDAWLASLQDAGVCHLADALDGLEGYAGISRPELRAEEVHADLLRSEASRALLGVERVLPATPRQRGNERRPLWTLGPGGLGEQELHALKDEARAIATSLGAELERVHERETEVRHLDALVAARAVLGRGLLGSADDATNAAGAHVFSLPRSTGARRARRLQRRLRGLLAADAKRPLRGAGERSYVVVLPCIAGSAPTPELSAAAAALGAEVLALSPPSASPDGAGPTPGASLEEATRREAEARVALTSEVAASGARGRFLLDSLEDADRRSRARRRLASSDHVTAARLYVRPEDEPLLRERLHAAHGESVVLRPLAERGDAPSLPRRIATAPFAVFDSLLPGRFGEVSAAALLALFTPLAVGVVWADVAGGVFLLLAGALLGSGAGTGSPRRDTALLAQIGGLLALVLGVLSGRAFGAAGEAWFGTDWGLAGAGGTDGFSFIGGFEPAWAGPFVGVAWLLGAVAVFAALWGFSLTLLARARGRAARGRAAALGALHYAVVAGLAAALLPVGHVLAWAWVVAPAGALALLILGGPRRFLLQLCLDLVGVLRLVAVAGAALLIFQLVLGSWVAPAGVALGVEAILVGTLALVVGALAVVADPAHLAMGVPYDLALGGSRLGQPFKPFRRRSRRREEGVREARHGG